MISVSEAKAIIKQSCKPLSTQKLLLTEAAGHVLAEDIYADTDHPYFAQAAMDGYAFCFEDLDESKSFKVKGEVAAGSSEKLRHQKGEAVRIFTGAPLPPGTNTVVMQEKVLVDKDVIQLQDNSIFKGSNVRAVGSELHSGDLALEKGTWLSPASIAFLASLGKQQIPIFPQPRVSIIITGKELQQPGVPLRYGQVFESNSFGLISALKQLYIRKVSTIWVDDDLAKLESTVQKELSNADMLLITGGVSVGDYDYTTRALAKCGVHKLFYKVKQKPGKPMYFGTKDNTLIFGLPGNPSSVLTCFYEYALPAIQFLMQLPNDLIRTLWLPLAEEYTKKPGLTQFLKGRIQEGEVVPLGAQESYRLASFALANCLIVLEEEKTFFEKGNRVNVHLLP